MTGFSIGHLNIRGLTSKVDEIRYLLFKHKFKIFCVSETFLGKRNSDVYYTLPNYEIVRRDRGHSNGGGLLCYLHSTVSFRVIQSIDCKNVECVILRIMPTGARPFIVLFVYRPPSSVINWETEFNDILSQCESICNEIIIMGDFNINLLDTKLKTKWDNKFCKPNSLSQMIKKATRVAEKSATLIDHVYSNRPSVLTKSDTIDCSLSDHDIIYTIRKVGVQFPKSRKRISFVDYSKFTPENVNIIFSGVQWRHLLYSSTSDQMIENFNQQFCSLIDRLVMIRSRFVKSEILPEWFDKEVQSEIKIRENLKKQGQWDRYKTQRNYVTNLIKRKKRKCVEDVIKDSKPGDTRKLWTMLNVNKKRDSHIETTLTPESLNSHFASIGNKLFRGSSGQYDRSCFSMPNKNVKTFISFPKFTPDKVIRYLSSVPDRKSAGTDGISVTMLKRTLPYILNIITDMFNRLLSDGVFPKCWKYAKVTPIFKGGSTQNPSDFRPISILPILSKLFEKHLNTHMLDHLNANKILADTQTGFRKGFSCTDVVHKIVSDCSRAKTRNETTALLFLDFKKAFDCVNHVLLLAKLKNIGFIDNSLKIISSFLEDRTQSTKINGKESSVAPITIGVPQGSILAPTLFLVFINDLLQIQLNSKSFAYADDTVFVNSNSNINSLEDCCNRDLRIIDCWCRSNRMSLNLEKSHFLLYNSKGQQNFILKIDNQVLERQTETKLLGMIISDTLSWDGHVECISRKLNNNINLLQLCRPFLNNRSAITFYYQFIFCHIIYGLHIYGNLSPRYVTDILFLLQKRSFRIIANIQHIPFSLISTNELSSALNLITLPFLIKHFTSIAGYRIFQRQCPIYLIEPYCMQRGNNFNLRDSVKLHTTNTTLLDNSIATTFNHLPIHIRSCQSMSLFKRSSKLYLSSLMQ